MFSLPQPLSLKAKVRKRYTMCVFIVVITTQVIHKYNKHARYCLLVLGKNCCLGEVGHKQARQQVQEEN